MAYDKLDNTTEDYKSKNTTEDKINKGKQTVLEVLKLTKTANILIWMATYSKGQ